VTIEFPRKLLHERTHDWNIVGNTMGAGQTTGASVDVRSDGGGFWSASLNEIRFRDRTDALLWRAVRQLCNGGVNPIVVPRNDTVFAPFVNGVKSKEVPHSDGTFFSDGSGYYQPMIDITCGPAGLRGTALDIILNYAGQLMGGESFSIDHPVMGWRIYEISTITMFTAINGRINFNPPLREAVDDGTRLEFDRPRCLMKLASPAAMDLNVTTYPFSLVGVKFIESKYAT
jgi:hypothetical protein